MRAGSTPLLTVLIAALSTAQPKPPGNLVIAQQGYLFAGGTYSDGKNGRIMSGQLYAEIRIPARRTRRLVDPFSQADVVRDVPPPVELRNDPKKCGAFLCPVVHSGAAAITVSPTHPARAGI
jgi:hypothetical protein